MKKVENKIGKYMKNNNNKKCIYVLVSFCIQELTKGSWINFSSPHQESAPYDSYVFNVREWANSKDIYLIIHIKRMWCWENNKSKPPFPLEQYRDQISWLGLA